VGYLRVMRFPFAAALVTLALLAPAAPAAAADPSPTPSCAEGPVRVGETIVGTACADTIVAPAGVARVVGGGGNDTIVAGPIAAALPCEGICLDVGSQTFEGGPGNDVVFGERGNDTLRGGEGNDRLYGGIGDDRLEGGPGDDLLSGGFGADSIDGQEGSDYVRGDGTIDHIRDTGASGVDTLSYSTGVTPSFGGNVAAEFAGFPPPTTGERGVRLDLSAKPGELDGNNGIAALGGGFDEVEPGAFERIVGSPFSDVIFGGEGGETIYGGGGADAILGNGGDDTIFGGADGDYIDGGEGENTVDGGPGSDNCIDPEAPTASHCEGTAQAVQARTGATVSVGLMAPESSLPPEFYVTGSSGDDEIEAVYSPGPPSPVVTVTDAAGDLDTSGADSGCTVAAGEATCLVGEAPDSIVLAGMAGDDTITTSGFPQSTGVVLLGGEGADHLTGGEGSEDVLVDGPGGDADVLEGLGRDDALLHNGGADQLRGGEGNDLFLSVSICDDETIDGGQGRDNSSWARLEGGGVEARLDASPARVGEFDGPGDPGCASGTPDTMLGIEDLEGSEAADLLVGDAGPNQLLGHKGPDEYFGEAGEDSILANSADSDAVIDCGPDQDSALIDVPHPGEYEDPAPIECERVREAEPNNFETVTELPPPPPVVEEAPSPPPPDTTPPRTKITWHPPRLIQLGHRHRRRVTFRFASSEPGSRFRCRLDGGPYRACTSPRAYTVGLGQHTVRIVAIDAAGNADPTPARFDFRVRRRPGRANR
jgi:Ca2+-binding RTX toxin-like protein